MITQKHLKEILCYDPETGIFIWLVDRSDNIKAGDVAGRTNIQYYIQIQINYKQYMTHRLAFLYMTENMPEYIDHINRDKADNRWCNLRKCSCSQNGGNRKIGKNSTTRYKGVRRTSKGFQGRIGINGKRINLGTYITPELAAMAYNTAAIKYFGKFAHINIIRKNNNV